MVRFQMFVETCEPRVLDLPRGCYTMGTADDNHIVVGVVGMASHHLEIRVTERGQTDVRVLAAEHGVTLNGREIVEAVVVPGDVLKLGNVVLIAELVGAGSGDPADSSVADGENGGWGAFLSSVPGAFGFPFTDGGPFIMGGVALFAGVTTFGGILTMPIGTLVGIVIDVYLLLVFRGITEASIQGCDSMPSDPEMIFDWWELRETLVPMFAVVLVPMLPYIIAGYWPDRPAWLQPCLGVMAILYVPMALLLLFVTDEFWAAHPGNVVLSVLRAPGGYLVVILCLLPVVGLGWFSDRLFADGVSRNRLLVAGLIGLLEFGRVYVMFFWARVLGVFYRAYRNDLGWEESVG